MKKICFITSTRADYGLLKHLMLRVKKSKKLKLQIIATAMHLEDEFGLTIRSIENDGFKVNKKISNILLNNNSNGVIKSAAVGMLGYADAFNELKPDVIFVLGDRYEIFTASFSSLVSNIPICHYSGGELTEGAYDDSLRHSITKMSNYHFVSAGEYRKRVIQLGENPKRVFLVGSLGHEAIRLTNRFNKKTLEKLLKVKFSNKNLLITYHPETNSSTDPSKAIREIISALEKLKDTTLIFTLPNHDKRSEKIKSIINEFCRNHDSAFLYKSLGQELYFSMIKIVDGVIGNSSSGLTEVPLFNKGTINIGSRQRGRISSPSVINCISSKKAIQLSLKKLYSKDFKCLLKKSKVQNKNLEASKLILKTLEKTDFKTNKYKKFYDIRV
jgi:GDP/UDP-N,N'-diacetylbacillosamine 2-epimerase (hydrolysing)